MTDQKDKLPVKPGYNPNKWKAGFDQRRGLRAIDQTDKAALYELFKAEERTGEVRAWVVRDVHLENLDNIEKFQEVVRESIRTGEPKKDRLYEWRRLRRKPTPEQAAELKELRNHLKQEQEKLK